MNAFPIHFQLHFNLSNLCLIHWAIFQSNVCFKLICFRHFIKCLCMRGRCIKHTEIQTNWSWTNSSFKWMLKWFHLLKTRWRARQDYINYNSNINVADPKCLLIRYSWNNYTLNLAVAHCTCVLHTWTAHNSMGYEIETRGKTYAASSTWDEWKYCWWKTKVSWLIFAG